MKTILLLSFLLTLFPLSFELSGEASLRPGEEALKKLMDGNDRYTHSKLQHPDQTLRRVKEVAKEQHPFAAILGCADSRVPPEVLFDEGLGDLFVIREIGNVTDNSTLGSLEYAVKHLGVSLIMVLGHERCGAVDASIHKSYDGHMGSLVERIFPAIEKAKSLQGDLLENSVRMNVKNTVSQLRASRPTLAALVDQGKLKIVGGYYSLDTGKVELVDDPTKDGAL